MNKKKYELFNNVMMHFIKLNKCVNYSYIMCVYYQTIKILCNYHLIKFEHYKINFNKNYQNSHL